MRVHATQTRPLHPAQQEEENRVRQAANSTLLRSFTLKRKLLFIILAVVTAASLPMSAISQAHDSPSSSDQSDITYKWKAYGGYGYTSLNQVNQSRSGLQGIDLSITRDFGKYFGITADGAGYSAPYATPVVANTTLSPTVDMVLFGPEFHVVVWEKVSGFAHVLIGGEHTGGTNQTPNISFAGGYGGGAEYTLTSRWGVRVSGDDIEQSFSVTGNSAALGNSAHKTRNPRASIGVTYSF
jgi:hypothetical protein